MVTKLAPWIEKLIRSHGTEQETMNGRLKAHVVGVGELSVSQAQGIEGPKGLLFLSDDVVQIPAIFQQDALDTLLAREDLEGISSFVNSIVFVEAYRLQFNMTSDETKCRFFLSVDHLVITQTRISNDNPPCCTSLSSVRMKICTTYRSLIGDSSIFTLNSQQGFYLSQQLGDWQHDYLTDLLEKIRERLRTQIYTQPSTSSSCRPQLSSGTYAKTGWDANRAKYEGEDCFCIPMSHLLIPDETELLRTPSEGSINGELVSDDMVQTKGNLWNMFVPAFELLRTSSASDTSMTLESTPPQESPSLLDQIPILVQPQPVPMATSTQVPSQLSMITQTDESRTEHSPFPPYQKPGTSHNHQGTLLAGSPSSPNECSGTENQCALIPAHAAPMSARDQVEVDGDGQEVLQKRPLNVKRKSSQRTPEAVVGMENEEVQRARSPPSWLFESQVVPMDGEGSSSKHANTPKVALRKPSNVHSDGTLFSYTYHLSGHILDTLSKFRVPDDSLHWAVKQLVLPKQTDNTHKIAMDQPRASPS